MKTLLLEFIENALSAALGSLSLIKKVKRHKVRNRVNRGGIAFNNASNCRTANRNYNEATNRNRNLGFRLVSVSFLPLMASPANNKRKRPFPDQSSGNIHQQSGSKMF